MWANDNTMTALFQNVQQRSGGELATLQALWRDEHGVGAAAAADVEHYPPTLNAAKLATFVRSLDESTQCDINAKLSGWDCAPCEGCHATVCRKCAVGGVCHDCAAPMAQLQNQFAQHGL